MHDQHRLRALRPALAIRSRVFHATRDFFWQEGYLEIDSPVRIPCPALELHIDAEPAGAQYLRTSPELHMKRLLAAGYERMVQPGAEMRWWVRLRLS